MLDLDPRSEVPNGKFTLRTLITDAVIAALTAAPFEEDGNLDDNGDPIDLAVDPEGYTTLFDFVERGVLDDITPERTPMATLEEGDETPDPKFYSVIDETFRVYVHFKVVKVEGIDPTALINYYFGRIGQVLVTPEHFADLAFDISEDGNSIQYQGKSDPEPGGSIWFDIDYRHGRGNRFSETGNDD